MRKYLNLPTHTKWGWLVFVAGLIIAGQLTVAFEPVPALNIAFSGLVWVFIIALVIEIGTKLIGKNKVTK